jgi:hypothetical protein
MSSISGHQRGIDGNKKIKGSKRHIIVDTMGLIICLSVHAANIHDSKGAKEVFEKLYEIRHDHERLEKIFADGGYEGELGQWLKEKLNLDMEIVKRNESGKWASTSTTLDSGTDFCLADELQTIGYGL